MIKILKEEDISYDDSGLKTIARVAAGSMRDGLSLLDQAIVFGNGVVSEEQVREMLGMMDDGYIEQLLAALADDDAKTLFALISRMRERSLDYISALDDMLSALHNISVCHVAREALESKEVDVERVAGLAEKISIEDVQLFYQIGLYGKRDLACAPDPASGFEMTLLRMLAFRPDNQEVSENGLGQRLENSRHATTGDNYHSKNQASSQTPNSTNHVAPDIEKNGAQDVDIRTANFIDLSNPDKWTSIVHDSELSGIVRELAMNMAPLSYENKTLTVEINAAVAELHNRERQETIEIEMRNKIGASISLNVKKSSETRSETPVENQERHEKEAKEKALQMLMNDQNVQEIIDQFEATVVQDSIQPADQRG